MHSMDRERRSVCMFSSNFFTASGLLVDIFDGVFDKKGINLGGRNFKKRLRNAGAHYSPPTHSQQGDIIRR